MNIACILSGGTGSRLDRQGPPKQYRLLCQKPVLLYSLQTFDACLEIDSLCVVAARAHHERIRQMAADAGIKKRLILSLPGKERYESAYSALLAVSHLCKADDVLLFHDAARPLISLSIITNNIRLAGEYDGVYTAIPAFDSVFLSEDGQTLSRLLHRKQLWQGQTPQSFRFDVIRKAHERYREMADPPVVTDDCSLVHLMGGSIGICTGDRRNLKLTTADDLAMLERYIEMGANEKVTP